MRPGLTQLEKLALQDAIDGLDPIEWAVLTGQIERLRVIRRVRTDTMFDTHFDLDSQVPRLETNKNWLLDGTGGDIGGVLVGFLLCIREGAIASLEGFTFGGQPYPHDTDQPLRLWRDCEQ